MKKHVLIVWLAVGAGVLVACGAQVGADQATATIASADVALKTSGPVVATDRGPVRGLSVNGIDKFLGIPYAAPPVGSLRWRPPQPAQRWTGLREASQFGSACPQVPNPFGTASTNEDCLYLNVFTPADAHGDHGNEVPHKLPVMVWLHTGALIVGSGDVFDPTLLVAQGVVVVTFSYRVGFLGTLAHGALSDESPDHTSGNYGIQDQQAALRWVQRNIGAFGGDPARVTIFGQSAGALSAYAHLASPLSAGLFRGVIAESPPNALAKKTLETAEAEGAAYAQSFGCSEQLVAACLREVSIEKLLQVTPPQGYLIVDGHVVTQQIGAALESGEFNEVPVLQGTTHDEWTLQVGLLIAQGASPISADQYPAFLGQVFGLPPNVAAFVMTLYPLAAYPTPSNAVGAIGTDLLFACPSRQQIRLLAKYVKVFAYEFNDANAPQQYLPPFDFPYGAYHAAEIQYLSAMPPPRPQLKDAQAQLSEVMIRYWTNFAKALDPNGDGLPAWPQYDLETDVFQSLVPPVPAPETGFASDHKCWLWSTEPE